MPDYLSFLAAHWTVYLLSMIAAMWLWTSLLTRRPVLGFLGAACGVALLFVGSPSFRWSLGVGQIDYLYFLPLSGFAYFYYLSQRTGNRGAALCSGAALAL